MRNMMGINYYWLPPNPLTRPIHIGKSSAGWCFALHVYMYGMPGMTPEELATFPAKNWDEWKELFAVKNSLIRDDYGEVRTAEGLMNVVTCRAWTSRVGTETEQWYRDNHAVAGPFGLSRQAIGEFCIEHGEGTWDCCVGDFS